MKGFNGLTALTLLMFIMLMPLTYFNKATAQGTGSFVSVMFYKSKGGCETIAGGGFIDYGQNRLKFEGARATIYSGNYISDCVANPISLSGGTMSFDSNYYPPASGSYALVLYECAGKECNPQNAIWKAPITSGYTSLSADIPLQSQPMTVNTGNPPMQYGTVSFCYALVSSTGQIYGNLGNSTSCFSGTTPIPPHPPVTSTCAINNGNAINVDLGTIDRALMPTTPGGGTPKTVPISVVCSGSVAASVNMKLNYTPVTMGSTQAIPTSTTGVGVAVSYNDAVLTPSDSKPISFIIGSNTVNLDFAAIRDPAVAVKDIAAGAFTASAVLVMTQQ